MKRVLGFLILAVLFAMLGMILHAKRGADPFAAEDENGVVYLWPGQAEPSSPALLVAPCPIGPQNLPILQPENEA